MNRNKRNKNIKQNEAISNMGNSTSFQSLHNGSDNPNSQGVNNHGSGEKDSKYFIRETY